MGSYINTIFSMKDRVVVVVGGLGQIGIHTSAMMLEAGARVVIIDTQSTTIDLSLTVLSDYAGGGNLALYDCDITDELLTIGTLEKIYATFSRVDVLVNHAHFKGDPRELKPHSKFFASFEDYPLSIWKEVVDVNLNSLFTICQFVGRKMIEQQGGVIINTSSTYGLGSPIPSIYGESGINSPISYATTKCAILNFTRYLAIHWAKYGIRANTISPGGVLNSNQSNEFIEKYSKQCPIGRLAEANEYKGALLFLASDASSYMTGSNLVIDGGWTAW